MHVVGCSGMSGLLEHCSRWANSWCLARMPGAGGTSHGARPSVAASDAPALNEPLVQSWQGSPNNALVVSNESIRMVNLGVSEQS